VWLKIRRISRESLEKGEFIQRKRGGICVKGKYEDPTGGLEKGGNSPGAM